MTACVSIESTYLSVRTYLSLRRKHLGIICMRKLWEWCDNSPIYDEMRKKYRCLSDNIRNKLILFLKSFIACTFHTISPFYILYLNPDMAFTNYSSYIWSQLRNFCHKCVKAAWQDSWHCWIRPLMVDC